MTPRSSRYSFELSFQLPDLIFQLASSFFPEAANNFSLLKRRGEGRHISTGPLTYITTKTFQLNDLKKFKTPENRKETYLMTPADAKRTSVIIGLTSSIILVGPTLRTYNITLRRNSAWEYYNFNLNTKKNIRFPKINKDRKIYLDLTRFACIDYKVLLMDQLVCPVEATN